MQLLPVDLTSLVAVVMGTSIVLIPVLGLTARFALKPTVEALSRFFDKKGQEESVLLLERRCALLESQVESMESQVRRLTELRDFDRQLSAPPPRELARAGDDPEGA